MNQIIINMEDVNQIVEDSAQLVFKPEAEAAILKILELKHTIDTALEQVKRVIGEAGETIDPGFKGVIGEYVKASYRVYGEKYTFDPAFKDTLLAAGIMVVKPSFKVDSAKVDGILKKTNTLPEGIIKKDRAKVISLTEINREEAPIKLQPSELLDAGPDR